MDYFIIENEEKKGPLSISDLAQIGISKSTLVWKKGLDGWVPAVKLEELNDIINSTPPPIPTTNEKASEEERNINLKIGFKKRAQSEVNSHNRRKVIEKAHFGLARELKSNLKLFPLSLLLFIPFFILIQYVFSSRRGKREYYNGRWNTYEFSDYWESNWVNDLDELIPRILVTFLFIIIFRYLLLLLKQLYRWFQHYSINENYEES
ncbi:MAG: DUF4339 domain-containing protein [Marinoscillum sp.]